MLEELVGGSYGPKAYALGDHHVHSTFTPARCPVSLGGRVRTYYVATYLHM